MWKALEDLARTTSVFHAATKDIGAQTASEVPTNHLPTSKGHSQEKTPITAHSSQMEVLVQQSDSELPNSENILFEVQNHDLLQGEINSNFKRPECTWRYCN